MSGKSKERKRTTRFLITSFTLLLLVSATAFLGLGLYANKASKVAIDKVGSLYMTGISEQITAHFRTLMNLKLEQVETVLTVVNSDMQNTEKLYEELVYRATVRNFDYLALCSESGDLQMLYGEQIQLADPDPFFKSLRNKEEKIAVGSDQSGDEIILFGINAKYPMKSGEDSMAMIAAVPIDYISSMLDTVGVGEGSLMYSHIIRKDGSFIISSMNQEYTDYFSSLYERYPESDSDNIDEYVQNLSESMENKEEYSAIMDFSKSRQQIYCTSLPYSEWHLITILPFGTLNQTVETMNRNTMITTVAIFAVILVILLFVFYVYFKLIFQQMEALEAARQEALRATKAKSEFLSNMSHDIRTPMNAIVGMTAIATTHIDDIEQVQNCLRKIALSGRHLLGLINDVLDMSKIESGKMTLTAERISLREIFDGIVSIVQTQVKGKEQSFLVHLDNIVTEDVYCDSVRLNQILLNLLSNAVKYTQEGGTIELSLYQEDTVPPKGADFVRTHILVKDNGMGMEEDFLKHIFDSYSRADSKRVQKVEGAGLGMAITKYIVDAMGGSITVKSKLHGGSEFHVILDLEKAEEQEIDMILPAWKMLVVDDDEVLCRAAVNVLESMGIHADWAMSGQKAIKMVTKHHEKRDNYQIVLLDWKLPDMNGIAVAKQMRRIMDVNMPILLISAYDWSEFETEAREAGISGFISKPLFKSTLFYGLKKHMGEEEAADVMTADMELSGRRGLVAEDNELNWEILDELLLDIGMELDWAENGKLCLEKFKESEPGYYDVIFMDIRMPVMNGYESTQAIRALERPDAKDIPIIAMTADAFSEDIQRCLDCGMNAHTAKPINLDEVISLLKRFILEKS